jgi:hypothetical protein
LTPVFLNNDIDLLAKLKSYLSRQTGREVQLGNGGGKLDHGSGGIGPLRAE